jgi:hypothetical protein
MTPSESGRRVAFAIVAALITSTANLSAQHSPADPDSARARIHSTLRAFYFNLAHHDWEAMTADILAAKVVAHRPAPEALVISAPGSASVECASRAAVLLEEATLTLDGDWAEVSVPRCIAGAVGTDEFRLINFDQRWRFVYIHLFEGPVNLSADR